VSEVSEYRRKAALECGANISVDPKNEDLRGIVTRELGDGADVVVEAVGPLLYEAIGLVRKGGRIIQFGHDELARPAIRVGDIVRNEISIYGAFIGKYCFEKVAKIIESGVLPLERVVSHQLPLSKIQEGFESLRKGQAIKVVIHPEN
jgi:threonine dehydrogenase-like Zn-dependent dehydrogenase